MQYYVVLVIIFSFTQLFTAFAVSFIVDGPEGLWSIGKGNAQNTYRIVPSIPTNYSKLPWTYEFNATSQDTAQFGRAVGINGDMYFFQSQVRGHPADWMICLTPNGDVRWTLFIEPVPEMEPSGVSNIVSDRQGVLFYTISYTGDTIYTAKICRVTHAQTSKPVQQCYQNYDLYMDINAPLGLQEKYDFLITAANDNEFESIPILLNKTTLKEVWIDRKVFGAGMDGQYRCDVSSGDIFWIGGDDRLLKFDRNGTKLINNFIDPSLSGFDFVLDMQQELVVRPWQNATVLPWKLLVSSSDVSKTEIKHRWTWLAPASIVENDIITAPSIDEKGTVYISSMPLAFALDSQGKTVWTTTLASASEMKTFQLVSFCVAMNVKRRVLYVTSGSPYFQKSKFLYFITAIHMDTGKILKRIDLNLSDNQSITIQCPILVGDEMFYFSYLVGQYPRKVPFKVLGIEQL